MALTGNYRETLQLYEPQESFDKGSATRNLHYVGNIRAARVRSREVEDFGPQRSHTNQIVRYRTRWRRDINQASVFVIDGLEYKVHSIEPVGVRDTLILNLQALK